MKLIICLMIFILSVKNFANDQTEDLDERITNLEIKDLTEKIRTNLEMSNLAGYFDYNSSINENSKYENIHLKNTLKLFFSGDVSKTFRVYTSFIVSYLYNQDFETNIKTQDTKSSNTTGLRPYLRTAYFDYRIFDGPFSLSVGRLPTTNGPPENLRNGGNRGGTYPALSYSLPLDGVAITSDLHRIFNWKTKLILRTIFFSASITSLESPYKGVSHDPTSDPRRLSSNSYGFSQMVEFESSDILWSRQFLGILQYSNYTFGSFVPVDAFSEASTFDSKPFYYEIYNDSNKLGSTSVYTSYLEFKNIFNLPVDFYMSNMYSKYKNQSNLKVKVLTGANSGVTSDSTDPYLTFTEMQGTRHMFGSRYNLKKLKLGFEYWFTNNEPLPTDLHTDDFIQMGHVIGEIFHPYMTYEILGKNARFRLGYLNIREEKRFSSLYYVNSNARVQVGYMGLVLKI